VRLLLDTCIIYDWLAGEITDAKIVELIRAEDAHASPVTLWEMAIKHRIGKLPLPITEVEAPITDQGFAWLPVQPAHAQTVFRLPALHRDPFDLMLFAQAKAEGMRIVTYDTIFSDYLPDTMIPSK
jgi:PIN domain nuclease of toxin-antitoxin system